MDSKAKWALSDEEKDKFIDSLAAELPMLRAKAGVPQDELAKLIGISRQTYGFIERKEKRMSWNTYLSLILFFDYNQSTHKTIRNLSAFPTVLFNRINEGNIEIDIESLIGATTEDINDVLDEQALHTIKTVIMIEYARCSNLPGEVVVKSFDGKSFRSNITKSNLAVKKALNNIRECGNKKL